MPVDLTLQLIQQKIDLTLQLVQQKKKKCLKYTGHHTAISWKDKEKYLIVGAVTLQDVFLKQMLWACPVIQSLGEKVTTGTYINFVLEYSLTLEDAHLLLKYLNYLTV